MIVAISIVVLIYGCKPQEEQEVTTSVAYSSDSLPSRWSNSSIFPIHLNISNDFNQDESVAITNAANSWTLDEQKSSSDFFTTSSENIDNKDNLASYEDNLFGIYKVYNWPESLPGTALAVTQINGLQKSSYIEITHADILLNYDFFSFTTDSSWGYDLQTVLVHEMGHFLGLYHESSSLEESVMYPTISRYHDNHAPKQNDKEKLASKYGLTIRGQANQAIKLPNSNEMGTPITIQLELYPDTREIIRINGKIQK